MIVAIIVILSASLITAYFFLSPSRPKMVTITGVNHEVSFTGISPPSPSEAFFSASSYSSGFSVAPNGAFNDTITFHSVPTMENFSVTGISVDSSTSSSFSIVAMNVTLPIRISSATDGAAIMLIIRVPNSGFKGQVTVLVTIGP